MISLIVLTVSFALCGAFHADYNGTHIRDLRPEYDFVIVGGGSAGCRIAEALSSNGEFNVLLLEAGGVPPESSKIPALGLMPLNSDEYDWKYKSVPQKTSMLSMKDKVRTLNAGRVLGGGSSINAMHYQRGNKEDYDRWVKEFAAEGWSFEEVLDLFKETEGCEDLELSDDFHGRSGAFNVKTFRESYPLKTALFKAAKEILGLECSDPNDGNHWGYSHLTSTVKRGGRVSSFNAFVEPHLHRANLHVSVHSQVLKVDFEGKRAVGVTFVKDQVVKRIRAAKEVILSAGALRSPQLMMLSGIGDEEHLKKFKIPLVKNLPGVGKNLHDHYGFKGIFAEVPDDDKLISDDVRALKQWLLYQTGPFEIPSGAGLGLLYTSTSDGKKSPDVELVPVISKENLFADDFPDEIQREYYGDSVGKSILSFINLIQRPKSRGEVRLASADPLDKPSIDPRYFSHPEDLELAVKSGRQLLDLLRSKTMRDAGVTLKERHFPACKKFELFSDEYLECLATHHTFHAYHYCGTCRIGARDDPLAVVDERLRVRGVDGLRVFDTSVMPSITVGHLMAPAVMIGTKGGRMILEEYDGHLQRGVSDEL